jgi:hypothetical protein
LHHLFGDTMILYYMPFVKIYASISAFLFY